MKPNFDVPGGEKINELRKQGYKLAKEILLPEYLSRHNVPEKMAEDLWIHLGYINRCSPDYFHRLETLEAARRERRFYEKLEKMERQFCLPEGQLIGLVDIALKRHQYNASSVEALKFLEQQAKIGPGDY